MIEEKEARVEQGKLSRRHFLRLTGLTAAGTILSACAPVTPEVVKETVEVSKEVEKVVTATPQPAEAETIELEWWTSGALFGETCQAIAEAFMQHYPNISVSVAPGKGGNSEPILSALAAGLPPDVAETYQTGDLMARDALLVVDDYIESTGFDCTDVPDAVWERTMWDGKTYGVSFQVDPVLGLAWNKGLFEEAGLDPEKAPETLDELRSTSDQLTVFDDAGNIEVIGLRPTDSIGTFIDAWAAIFDTEVFDFESRRYLIDTPPMAEAAQYILGFYEAYGAEQMEAFSTAYGYWTSPDSAFCRGVQALYIGAESMCGPMDEYAPDIEWGVDWMPTKTGKKLQLLGGHCNCIPVGVPHPAAAWELVAFAVSEEAGDILWNMAGLHPVTYSYLNHIKEDLDTSVKTNLGWYIDSLLGQPDLRQLPGYLPLMSKARSDWNAMISEVAFERMSLEEGLRELQGAMDAACEETFR